MTLEERAELEQLRQQHELPRKIPGHGGDDGDILHRLKTLPEDEAMTLLLQLRSGARVHDVSSEPSHVVNSFNS